MKVLKQMTWNDDWSHYIQYGKLKSEEREVEIKHMRDFGRILTPPMPDALTFGILHLMHQFQSGDYGYTVYEAYLKAVEIKSASYTENCLGTTLKRLIHFKKQEIKNLKQGIFDEELKDLINAVEKGYKEWVEHPYKHCEEQEE